MGELPHESKMDQSAPPSESFPMKCLFLPYNSINPPVITKVWRLKKKKKVLRILNNKMNQFSRDFQRCFAQGLHFYKKAQCKWKTTLHLLSKKKKHLYNTCLFSAGKYKISLSSCSKEPWVSWHWCALWIHQYLHNVFASFE